MNDAIIPAGANAGGAGAVTTQPGRWEKAQLGPLNLPEATKRSMTNSLLSAIVHVPHSGWDKSGEFVAPRPRFQMKQNVLRREEIHHNLRAVVAGFVVAREFEVAPIVAALKARTRGRNEGDSEARFNANVLISDLCAYPLDVVRDACDAWIDTPDGRWFPTWADLKALCEDRMRGRRALQKGLNWLLDPSSL